MFVTSQDASLTYSASTTGLFVKHLLAVMVKENLSRLEVGKEVFLYIYVVIDKYHFTVNRAFPMSVTLLFQ